MSQTPIGVIDDPALAKILVQKLLELPDEIIEERYDDVFLGKDIRDGFDLVGVVPTSAILPGKVAPASWHPDELCAANEALRTFLGFCRDDELDKEFWEKTLRSIGWLIGPMEWKELTPITFLALKPDA